MNELIKKYVGKNATIALGGLEVEVKIKEVKMMYGKNQYLVSPLKGTGEKWVNSVKLK